MKKNDSKGNTYLIRVHLFFFANFLIELHYLDHPLFTQAFFRKNFFSFFWSFLALYFFLNSFLFQTCPFFANFHSTFKNIFFWKHSFFRFFYLLFKIKHHPISRKKQNEKLFFVFFQKLKTHFLFWQVRVNFFEFWWHHKIY